MEAEREEVEVEDDVEMVEEEVEIKDEMEMVEEKVEGKESGRNDKKMNSQMTNQM